MECMRLIKKFSLAVFCLLLFSCSGWTNLFDYESGDSVVIKKKSSEMNPPSELQQAERLWTILVYMCADNDLEAAAMEDLCEMEFSDLNTSTVTVLALIDRSPSYDTSYDNWYGSRLYKLQTGRAADSRKLISEEIECLDLGLAAGKETELDMSSSYVLSSSLSYVRKKFPANNYGLIIWGHGTGWRGNEMEASVDVSGLFKGFSYDGSSGTYMTLYQTGEGLKNGLNGTKLDFLGFDTCYGAELEVLYELKDYAKLCSGSEGLISASGWNYKELFSYFEKSEKRPSDLCASVIYQFKKQYAYKTGASIVSLDLEKLQPFFDSCNQMWDACADKINRTAVRDEIMQLLYSSSSSVKRYTYGSAGSDVYLDLPSMMTSLCSYFNEPEISRIYDAFETCKKNLIKDSWTSEWGQGGLGVYFSSLSDSSNLSVSHPLPYKKGACADQISFVKDCDAYVPLGNDGKSFLSKLFYTQF